MNKKNNESGLPQNDQMNHSGNRSKTIFERMEDFLRSNPQRANILFQEMRKQIVQKMQEQFSEACQNLRQKLSNTSISAEKAQHFSQAEIKLSLYSFWKEHDLMYALGIWDKQNLKRFETIRNRIVSEQVDQRKSEHPNITAVTLLLDTETIFAYAAQCGVYFSHNDALKASVKQLSSALSLYNLSFLNLNGKEYNFEDGTPPCFDWGKNKTSDETEHIVLYNTIMTLNAYTDERDVLIRILTERLIENKVACAVQNLQEQSFDLLLDNPEQALHIYLACDHLKSLLKFQEPIDTLHHQFLIHHTMMEMKNFLEAQDNETTPMILNWYQQCTHGFIETMPEEVKKSQLKIVSHQSKPKNNIEQREKDD